MADLSIDSIARQLQNILAELREMKFAAEVERRNSRSALDNMVTEVGIKFDTFEAAVEHRLEAMDGRLGTVDERLATVQQDMGTVRQQLDRIEQLLTARGAPS
jgi:DNA anti-recombination protein RmuC